MKTGTDAVGLDHNPNLADTRAEATMSPAEAIPGHTTGTADAITGVLPGAHAQMPIHIALAMTPYIEDHLCTEALQLTLETTADHDLNQHTNQLRRPHTRIYHDPGDPKIKHILREMQRVKIDDPQMDF